MYNILPYTYKKAKELGVDVYPSKNKKYKLDVFKNNSFLFSIGASGYKDYPTYIQEKGLYYANKRRELYKKRHQKDRTVIGSRGYYADKLLW
jgi:hypothetical protein